MASDESCQAQVHHLAHALGHLRPRKRENAGAAIGLAEVAHDLQDEERVAAVSALNAAHQLAGELSPAQALGELGDSRVGQPRERQALDELALCQARSASAAGPVAGDVGGSLGGEHEQARSRGAPPAHV